MFEKYDAYKDSCVNWLGSIPKHWEIKSLKFICKLQSGETIRPEDFSDEGFPVYGGNGFRGFTKKYTNEGLHVLIGRQGALCGNVNYADGKFYASEHAIVVYPYKNVDTYWLGEMIRVADLNKYSQSAAQPGIAVNVIENIRFPFPHLSEQKNISDFLRENTLLLDQAIAIKEQQITLLNERKQIVIQKAVTQGLDPNVPMKDSGVEWIGEIPKHWELKKIKHVTSKIGSGVTPSGGGATYLDEGIPLLRSQNIHFDRIYLNDVARISEKVHNSMSNSKVRQNDVLLNITGGSIGRCYFVESTEEMNVNQHVCILRPKKNITSIFLNAVLASEVGQGQIWYFQQGGGREGLNFQALKNFDIALPPIGEQILISKKVEEIYQQFGNMNAHIQMQIEKLKEYKTTLINDAVTGKIKVA